MFETDRNESSPESVVKRKRIIHPRCEGVEDSGEELIIDHVVLRGDMTGAQVQNSANGAGVGGRDPEEHTTTGPRTPFGKFLTVLERRVKNINRAAPNTGALKMAVVVKGGASEQFDRGKQGVFPRQVVPKVDSMFKRERPKIQLRLFWPMESVVQKHRPSPFGHSLDRALGNTILMMSTHTGERYRLILGHKVSLKFGRVKRHVIRTKGLQSMTT